MLPLNIEIMGQGLVVIEYCMGGAATRGRVGGLGDLSIRWPGNF